MPLMRSKITYFTNNAVTTRHNPQKMLPNTNSSCVDEAGGGGGVASCAALGGSAARAAVTVYTVGTIKHVPDIRTYVAVDGGYGDNPRPVITEALDEAGVETFLGRQVEAAAADWTAPLPAASTSRRTMRPCGPVPLTDFRSTPF